MPTVLVTAGPTREHLDEVRFLTNASTGRMGYAIAAAAHAAGCEVVLVTGPTHLTPPAGVTDVQVVSALEMLAACERALARADIVFGVAAVADHRPRARHAGKPAKNDAPYSLELVPNPDILASLARVKGRRVFVGFSLDAQAADASAQRERARRKLERKGLDLIVVNDSSALGAERSAVTVLDAGGHDYALPPQDKEATAAWLVQLALARWRTRVDEASP
ncbi:MAG: phosphopantothenoylcysteine decarboxylase [Planctomycetota bacterium]